MYANFEYKYFTIFTQSRFLYYAKTVLLITITMVHGTQAENIMKCPLCHKNSNIWLFVTNTKSQITFYLIPTLSAAYWLCLWCLAALRKNPSKTNSTNTEFRNDFSQFVFQCHFHGFDLSSLLALNYSPPPQNQNYQLLHPKIPTQVDDTCWGAMQNIRYRARTMHLVCI